MSTKEVAVAAEQNQTESIFSYYSISNEVDFVSSLEHLSPSEQSFYLRESIYGFLGEFAGKIPYKKLPYIVRENKLSFAGIDVVDAYKKTAQISGVGSREWNETVGISQVEDAFIHHEVNSATVLSPPTGDYSYAFAFHFEDSGFDPEIQADVINQYIIRYDEKRNQLGNTSKISSQIDLDCAENYQEANDYLSNPIINTSKDLLLKAAGISTKDISYSEQFEQLIRTQLSERVDDYILGIQTLSHSDLNPIDRQLLETDVKRIVTGLFNMSKEIARSLKAHKRAHYDQTCAQDFPALFDPYYIQQQFSHYAEKEAVVAGGGSCPVTGRITQLGLGTIASEIQSGETLSSILENHGTSSDTLSCVTCPFCKKTVDAFIRSGKIHCPKCKSSAKIN